MCGLMQAKYSMLAHARTSARPSAGACVVTLPGYPFPSTRHRPGREGMKGRQEQGNDGGA